MTKETNERKEGIRVVPDQLIAYLAEHDFYDPRTLVELEKLRADPSKLTYDDLRNSVFFDREISNDGDITKKRLNDLNQLLRTNPGLMIKGGSILVNNYLEKKLSSSSDPVSEEFLRENAPYSHPCEFVLPLDARYKLIDDIGLGDLSRLAFSAVHSVSRDTMSEIDLTERTDSEFEGKYIDGIKSILIAIPRILTMAARDPYEDFSQLPLEKARALNEEILAKPNIIAGGTDQYERRSQFMKDASGLWKSIADIVSERVQYEGERK